MVMSRRIAGRVGVAGSAARATGRSSRGGYVHRAGPTPRSQADAAGVLDEGGWHGLRFHLAQALHRAQKPSFGRSID